MAPPPSGVIPWVPSRGRLGYNSLGKPVRPRNVVAHKIANGDLSSCKTRRDGIDWIVDGLERWPSGLRRRFAKPL